MTTKPVRTIKEIQALFAATLLTATGARVEVFSRAKFLWTFCGSAEDVRVAVAYVESNKRMQLVSPIVHDDELGESFAYLDDRISA
jgi:hypothetical protein